MRPTDSLRLIRRFSRTKYIVCRIYGFISRKTGTKVGNECHVLADYAHENSAEQIVKILTDAVVQASRVD